MAPRFPFFRPRGLPAPQPTRVPPGLVVYAIGDIHGELALLRRLVSLIIADAASRPGLAPVVVCVGDYVDRGTDSRGVLDFLLADPLPSGFALHLLRGNHDQAMLDAWEQPAAIPSWLEFGGVESLASYGIRAAPGTRDRARCAALHAQLRAAMPAAHVALLRRLEPMLILGDYAFVHAGVRPGRALERQVLADLLWMREPFLSATEWHGKRIVHGHSSVPEVVLLSNRIAIDTGAYAGGPLSALVLADGEHSAISISADFSTD